VTGPDPDTGSDPGSPPIPDTELESGARSDPVGTASASTTAAGIPSSAVLSPMPHTSRDDSGSGVAAGWPPHRAGCDSSRLLGFTSLDPGSPRPDGARGGSGTAPAGSTESGRGKRCGERGPCGTGGTSPKRSSSSERRPVASPASRAACASSAGMMRTPSAGRRCGDRSPRCLRSLTASLLGTSESRLVPGRQARIIRLVVLPLCGEGPGRRQPRNRG
jgi:hypothetical protein